MIQSTAPSPTGLSATAAARALSRAASTEPMELINKSVDTVVLEGSGYAHGVSEDGRFVAFAAQTRPRQWTGNWNPGPQPPFHLYLRDRHTGDTTRIDRGPRGEDNDEGVVVDGGKGVGLSSDGRIVAFASQASNLVDGDANRCSDIFVYDGQKRALSRISVAPDGTEADGPSYEPVVSADGKWVAFRSSATNLVEGRSRHREDIYLHHIPTGVTRRVSEATQEGPGSGAACMPAISGDGRYVAFSYMGRGLAELPPARSGFDRDYGIVSQIYVHDCRTGETRMVSRAADGTPASGDCVDTAISADGSTVAFASRPSLYEGRTNLAPGVETMSVYVWRPETGVQLASVDDSGKAISAHTPSLSRDGSHMAFNTRGRVVVQGPDGPKQTLERPSDKGYLSGATLSASGNNVAFTSIEENEDVADLRVSRVFTFDLDRLGALTSWAQADEAVTAGAISVGDDYVVIGGLKVPRRTA